MIVQIQCIFHSQHGSNTKGTRISTTITICQNLFCAFEASKLPSSKLEIFEDRGLFSLTNSCFCSLGVFHLLDDRP
ncbi:hypothetical protein Ndes2437A_g01314 [Nannochloris sp. 'desiccata']